MEFETKILKPTKNNIKICAGAIKKGQLVGMPTETVYGLGANAFDEKAVNSVFVAKNRPQDNPLIVHVHKKYDLNLLVSEITPLAKTILKRFTPGPITLVMKSNGKVANAVSRGLNTVAIRIPKHKIAQKFLKECNLPIAAPSANISSRMSATTAQFVKDELDGKLPYILDGGECEVGIESTVVDVTGDTPIILRPGKITKEQLLKAAKKVNEKTKYSENDKVASPGVKYKHYSPKIPVFVCEHKQYSKARQVYRHMQENSLNPVILCLKHEIKHFEGFNVISFGKKFEHMAKNLYKYLRYAEKSFDAVVICNVENQGLGSAINNRVSKMHSYEFKENKENKK